MNAYTAYRGKASEALALQAFETLKERRLRGKIPMIAEVIPAEPNSEQDKEGADIKLKFHASVKERGVQVRSSEWGRRRYLFQCAQKGVDPLPCLVASPLDTPRTVLKRALRLLKIMFSSAKCRASKLVRDIREEFDTIWEKRLEHKWWRRRKRRAPHRVRMAFNY